MPSETIATGILGLLEAPIESFRSALAATLEELRSVLEEREEEERGPRDPDTTPLGAFATGRIDAGRFEALLVRGPRHDPGNTPVLRRAFSTLSELDARRTSLFHIAIRPGGRLSEAVHVAFADIGRAFGAARIVDLVQAGRYCEEEHGEWLTSLPFSRWSVRERLLAPPLVIEIDGADLQPEGLAEFLDGGVRLVLLVDPPAPRAALVRLVTPAVSVLQSGDLAGETGLEGFLALPPPAVAAWISEGAVAFRHRGGEAECGSLEVETVPDEPGNAIGGRSVAQLSDDLALLRALAPRTEAAPASPEATDTMAIATAADPSPDEAAPVVPSPAPVAPVAPDPGAPANEVDRLAAWMIAQADLNGID